MRLVGNRLVIFRNTNTPLPVNVISLYVADARGMQIKPSASDAKLFTIDAAGRTTQFKAKNKQERDEWIRALHISDRFSQTARELLGHHVSVPLVEFLSTVKGHFSLLTCGVCVFA